MANLTDFIQVWDDSLDEKTCQFLINFYEQNSEYTDLKTEIEYGYNYSELNLTEFRNVSTEVNEIQKQLIHKVYEHRDEYYELIHSEVFPESHAFEYFKIQKFEVDNQNHYFTKVDIKEYDSARRFLAFTWFLNDNTSGQYEFLDLFVQPQIGRVMVYPPFWMFPKKKNIPVNESQYVLTTYLHYK
jgi:prolyl 4-hydroxylase